MPRDDPLPWRRAAESGQCPLLLVRHGRTACNAERRMVGRLDVPLDARGREQGAALASRLAALPLAGIYSSPLLRARQTAAAIGEPTLVEDLQELDHGELEGLPREQAHRRYAAFFRDWDRHPATARVPGGERLCDCRDRALAALRRIASRHGAGGPVVVVTHQMVIASVLVHSLGLPLRFYRLAIRPNGSIDLLGVSPDGSLRAWRLNDRAHLPPTGGGC